MRAFKEKFINLIKKGLSYLNDKRSIISRSVAMILCVAICMNTLWNIYYSDALADMVAYNQQNLTNQGLNSPLLRDEVTAEKFEPWELEVFGIFLSNFCVPFADSMHSALQPDSGYGSRGRGLDALKFSCGGDVQAGGILQNMVMYVLDQCDTSHHQLLIAPKIFKNGEQLNLAGTEAEKGRHAKLADILPIFCGFYSMRDLAGEVEAWTLGEDNNNVLKTDMSNTADFSNGKQDVLDHSWMLCGYANAEANDVIKDDSIVRIMPNLASLPSLCLECGDGSKETVFELSDSWDAQVLAMCINYGFGKAMELDESTEHSTKTTCLAEMEDLLFKGLDSDLYMDACGNIVAKYQGNFIVIIPACMNNHLMANKNSLNLLVAPILNDLCAAPYANIAAGVSNQASLIDKVVDAEEHFFGYDAATLERGLIGSGLGIDTGISVNVSENGDTSGVFDTENGANGQGITQYGNLLLYNTSDHAFGYETSDIMSAHEGEIRTFMKRSSVDLQNNLCIGVIGTALRVPTTTIDDLFGAYSSDDGDKLGLVTDGNTNGPYLYKAKSNGSSTPSYNFNEAVINKLVDYFGSKIDPSIEPVMSVQGTQRAAAAAQLLQVWGVNNDNHFDLVNNSYVISLSESEKDAHEIVSTSRVIYADNLMIANAKEGNAFHNWVRNHLFLSSAGAAGIGVAAGIVAGLIFSSTPVGWIAGGIIGLASLIVVLLWGDDEDDIPFMDKAALCVHLMWANGRANALDKYEETPIKPEDNAETWNTKIQTLSMKDLGKALGNTQTSVFASAIANGYVSGFGPANQEYKKLAYNTMLTLDESSAEESEAFINGSIRAGYSVQHSDALDNAMRGFGQSLSIVAAPNEGLTKAKAYLCFCDNEIGTFDRLATWMYLDYLKWYGFNEAEGPDAKFNKHLFSALKSPLVDPDARSGVYEMIFGDEALTEDQKRQRVQDYTYLSLAPTAEGVEYRNQLAVDGEMKYLATEYNKVCYGDAIASNSIGTDGMLKMVPYSENFMTKWLIANWDRILVISTLLAVVILFIVMALKGRKITWFIATLLSTILMLVVLPSSGEITPYVCDKIVQSMFQKGAQYWAINEGIESTYLVQEAIESDAQSAEALQFIKALSITNTSKTLMLKRDISKKIVCNKETDTQKLLRLQSTRWILNSLIRQISADDPGDKYSYVYVTLDDMRGELKDLFLLYENNNLNTSSKYNRPYIEDSNAKWFESLVTVSNTKDLESTLKKYYDGYKSVLRNTSVADEMLTRYKSITQVPDIFVRSAHVKFGYLARLYYNASGSYYGQGTTGAPPITIPSIADENGHISIASIDAFQEKISDEKGKAYTDIGTTNDWRAFTDFIGKTQLGTRYNEQGAHQEYGFLHLTEDVIPYFYLVVKDTFNFDFSKVDADGKVSISYEEADYQSKAAEKNDNIGLGTLMTNLLGGYSRNGNGLVDDNSKRVGVQYYRDITWTGAPDTVTRDVLDLEYLFTNYVPYLASVMFLAGGTDGTDGMLGANTMESVGFKLYGDSLASWLYRSNWVIKLISGTNYSSRTAVRDKDGNVYEVEHQLFPQNYPEERPMIFSEAQMWQYGLTESELTRAELACVETNRDVAQAWQMLVNYANTDGIDANIIEEQMALEAAMIFNKNFVDDNFISSEAALYPTSFDLRSINFDSVLKLIVISDNYNNASLQQDAIYTIMADKGYWGGKLAYWAAWSAQTAVPFSRNLALGVLFYLSLVSCLYNLFNDNRQKAKASMGGIISNSVYAVWTIAYYCIYWLLITRAGGDLILTEDGFNTGTSNIMWKLILILIATWVYIIKSWTYLFRFIIKDVPNMGMSIMGQYVRGTYARLKTFSNKVKSRFGSKKAAEELRSSAAKEVADARNNAEGGGNDGNGGDIPGGDSADNKVSIDGGSVSIKNDKSNPIPVYTTNAPGDATYIEGSDGTDDSGFIEEDTSGSDATVGSDESGSTTVDVGPTGE